MKKLHQSIWAPANTRFETANDLSGTSSKVASADITYQNGQVINNPQIYNIYIGDWTSAASKTRVSRLNQFITDLLASSWMTTLAQYGCNQPGKFAGTLFIPNPSVAGTDDSDSGVESIIQAAINQGIVPEPAGNNNVVFVLFLDDNTGITDSGLGITMCAPSGNNAFGYHHYFVTNAGNNCYYAVIPGLTDACVKNTCSGILSGCSLSLSDTQEQRQTQVLSHELAEMITNPEGSGGWYDIATGNEVGDICNGNMSTIKAGPNTWDVQQVYSKGDKSCTISSSAAGVSVQSSMDIQADIRNKYNLLGGAFGGALGILMAAHRKSSVIGFAAFGLGGFIAGFVATDAGKKQLSPAEAGQIKGIINQVI